jgi:hypothetical protein
MQSIYLAFLKRLIIFSLILGAFAGVLFFLVPSKYFSPALPFLIPFFIAVTLINSYILIRSSRKKFISYLNVYLLTTIIRLFLYIAVMVLYIFLNKADMFPFATAFFLLYLCYTIFEVVWLVSFSKTGNS